MLLVGISSDWLYPAPEIKELADRVGAIGKDVVYQEMISPFGHDAFLKEWDLLTDIITPFIERSLPR